MTAPGWLAAAVLAGGIAAPASALAPLQPDDFAWQLPLTVSGNNGVVQFRLPVSIWQHARQPGLADLQLFDAQGQALPFALHQPRATIRSSARQSAARLFPVPASTGQGTVELSLRVDAEGALVSVPTRPASTTAQTALEALVIDVGAAVAGETLESIQLLLPDERSGYHARIVVQQSEDLKLWDTVAHSRVDWLQAAAGGSSDAPLVNDQIALGGVTARYLRLQWLDGEPLQFAGVVAHWRSRQPSPPDPDLLELVIDPQTTEQGDWRYVASPSIAATEVGLDLPQPNTVLPVTIGFSRQRAAGADAQFQPQLRSVFYRLTQDGRERRSSRLAIAAMAAQTWLVRPERAGEAAPRLVLRWPPRTLVFTARGTAFTLAVGTTRAVPGQTALDQVAPGFSADELARLEHAVAGAGHASPARVEVERPLPSQQAPSAAARRTWVLWSLLLLGVAVLAWMSVRLFKQINAASDESGR